MKNKLKLALVAVMALNTTVLMATNGSNLIATGSQARSMGGTGVGISHGAESALANVALITDVEKTEVSFGGMFFMPDVTNKDAVNLGQLGDESSSASSVSDLNVIPEVSIASKVNENFYMGIGIWGTAGMGVDYRDTDDSGQMEMVTNLQLMQFALPLAYKKDGFSIGVTPLIQYGSLDINYNMSQSLQKAMISNSMQQSGATQDQIDAQLQTVTSDKNVGSGLAQDLKFGYNFGIAYTAKNGITIGAMYKSQIDMYYKSVLTTAIRAMEVDYDNDTLSTPAEIGFGISYAKNRHRFAFDYKKIKWSDAKGYQDFDWDDQNVYAFGYEYKLKDYGLRLGYNYAKSPISEQSMSSVNSAGLPGGLVNTFNTLGFPGIVETHYTIGGYFRLNEQTLLATAFVYAPEETISYDNFLGQKSTTTHGQTSVSFDLVYRF